MRAGTPGIPSILTYAGQPAPVGSGFDDAVPRDHDDATLGHVEPASPVVVVVDPDLRVLVDHRVLVDDRPADRRVAADLDRVEDDAVDDRRVAVDLDPRREDRPVDLRTGDDAARGDRRVQGLS